MRTWPPSAGAWSELVNRMWSLLFRFVTAAMAIHHHTGDVVSIDSSPISAFFFTRLRIGAGQADQEHLAHNDAVAGERARLRRRGWRLCPPRGTCVCGALLLAWCTDRVR